MRRKGPHRATRDHKLPRSKGGALTFENRIIVCRRCNEDKRDLTIGEWHLDLRSVADPRARRVWLVLATNP